MIQNNPAFGCVGTVPFSTTLRLSVLYLSHLLSASSLRSYFSVIFFIRLSACALSRKFHLSLLFRSIRCLGCTFIFYYAFHLLVYINRFSRSLPIVRWLCRFHFQYFRVYILPAEAIQRYQAHVKSLPSSLLFPS